MEGKFLEDVIGVILVESEGGPSLVEGRLTGEFTEKEAGSRARAAGDFSGTGISVGFISRLGRDAAKKAGGKKGAWDGFHDVH